MKIILALILLLAAVGSISAQNNYNPDLNDFLKLFAIKGDLAGVRENINYFLDSDFEKTSVSWRLGRIETTKGVVFDSVSLKLNTINNSVYLRIAENVFRISSQNLNEFSFYENDKVLEFKKGYGIPGLHELNAQFIGQISSVLKHVSEYKETGKFEIREVSFIKKEQESELTIKLMTGKMEVLADFQKYLSEFNSILNLSRNVVSTEVSESTFFQVIVDRQGYQLLKHHTKKMSKSESISLIQHSQTHLFDKGVYFFANHSQEIIKVVLTRKSIKKGLQFLDVYFPEIPIIINEKQLVRWFSEIDLNTISH